MVIETVGVILARGGSKGVPRKNVVPFAGAPLISWSILQLKQAGLERVIVSTDSAEIANIASEYGAETLRRPDHLSSDSADGDSALVHGARELSLTPETRIVLAQATSPLRLPAHFSEALKLFEHEEADSLFSAVEFADLCAWSKEPSLRSVTYDFETRGNRQARQPLLVENGSFYITRVRTLLRFENRLGGKISSYTMPKWTMPEIDDPADLELCLPLMLNFVIPWLEPVYQTKTSAKKED